MPAKNAARKKMKPKAQKSKRHQMLISRFFAPATTKQPSKPNTTSTKNQDTTPIQSSAQKQQLHSKKEGSQNVSKAMPSQPSEQKEVGNKSEERPAPSPHNSECPATPTKASAQTGHDDQTAHIESVSNSNRPEPDTPVTAVALSPSQNAETASNSSSPVRRIPRRKRRLFVVDDDDEGSDEEPSQKKMKSDDPDFEMGHSRDQSDDADDELEQVMSDDLCEEGAHESDMEVEEKDTAQRTGFDALSSFEFHQGQEPKAITRDSKRRKKFNQKIGRLEQNSFFLRRTGGGAADIVEEKRNVKKTLKYTPLETQIVKLRKQHPDMVLVVECGYKYRLFDKDATIASKVLRVASFFDHNFLTASFPTHRLPFHVRRLVEAGHKVGVISQSETAALKKASSKSSGLFERKLSAVYTKGTIMADGKLGGAKGLGNAALSNAAFYIMTILEVDSTQVDDFDNKKWIAIAAVDSASGDVFYDSFEDDALRSDLESRLVTIEPVEILMPKTPCSKATEIAVKGYCEAMNSRLERMAKDAFNPEAVEEEIRSKVQNSISPQQHSESHIVSCVGALIEYLKQFKLELSVTKAMEYKEFQTKRQMKIGADVLRNLEVFGNSNNGSTYGSLVGLVNRTKTAFGNRQMRQWLSHPLVKGKEIRDRLDTVAYLCMVVKDNREVGEAALVIDNALSSLICRLAKLPDLDQALTRIACHKSTPSELVTILTSMQDVCEKLTGIKCESAKSSLPTLLAKLVSSAPDIAVIMNDPIVQVLKQEQASMDKYNDLFDIDELAREALLDSESKLQFISHAEELQKANDALRAAERGMVKILRRLREEHSNPKWEWKKVAQEEYLIEVPVGRASSLPRSWTIVSQTKALKRFRPPEADRGYDKVRCSRETRDALASKCWLSYLKMFAELAQPLRVVVRVLADLDCLSALAEVACMPGYTKPEIETDPNKPAGLIAEDARHPLTELLPSCSSYVPNNIHLGSGEHEIALIISGPNYGGKSSYARMAALIVILAQLGSFVPAASAKLCPYDSIYARMGSSDSISKGMSSLMVELAETSRILSAASRNSLVVMDELGRGTSTHDGTAIAYATLSHLVANTGCTTLFVTHFPMIASLRGLYPHLIRASYMDYLEVKDGMINALSPEVDDSGLKNSSSQEQIKSRIIFLYKLTDGVAPSSYGLNVARLAGIPEEVIDEAQAKAFDLETSMKLQKKDGEMAHLMGNALWQRNDVVQYISRIVEQGSKT
ncbi:DNA mismatch repair protein Msh3 [Gracilariopsis chorda]|uniref:DNA mismatch repair protein n=1 Tax=Gracilariopsis chorda TaxID=448386 RepID=A0A2V3J6Y4_9FLOR|nr:DNA mismatch repair protein Msh3 [Gracilariopsis chorda]|eukprot:PXF50181.1 DNA mismatch repair protein Msh3 [Gracilariopsis chorda]